MKKNFWFIILLSFALNAQNFKNAKIDLGFEYRPRTEFRNGYKELPSNEDNFAFFTSHRARINIDYSLDNFLLHTTLQDIRFWGDTDTRNANGKAQFYEFYVEPRINKYFKVRVGRQKIKYDNQRLFAENNWRQAGGQHDAVRLMYKNNKIESDLILAFNQNNEQLFGIAYDIDWDFYRGLVAHFLKLQVNKNLRFTSINFADEYTDPNTNDEVGYIKITNGGKITYKVSRFKFNFAMYYQWGRLETLKKHQAYYLESEIKWLPQKKYNVALGIQYFSGDSNANDNNSTAFLAQYGAFHKHNGQMDYVASTVSAYEHRGVFNPYLKQNFNLNNKLSIHWQSHLLGTTTKLKTTINNNVKNYNNLYAWENDFKAKYKANSYTTIEAAYMFLKASEGIQLLDNGINGDINQLAHYFYVSVTWNSKLYYNK